MDSTTSDPQDHRRGRLYLPLAILALLYLAINLWNLMALPIFQDEALYLRRAQLVLSGHPFVTFEVRNIKPLFVWLVAAGWRLCNDPLVVARMISLVCGLISLAAIYFTAARWRSTKTGLLAGALYLLVPYTLFYNRLGLYEALTLAMSALALAFGWQAVNRAQTRDAALFGLASGLALINKEMGYFFLAYPLAMLVGRWWAKKELRILRLAPRLMLGWGMALAILLSVIAYPLIHFRRGLFHSTHYFMSAEDLATFPLARWGHNLLTVTDSYINYLGILIPFLALVQFVRALIKRQAFGVGCGLCWLGPVTMIVLISDIFFSRYLLFTVPPILFLTAGAIEALAGRLAHWTRIPQGAATVLLAVLVLLQTLPLLVGLSKYPINAKFWQPDRDQFVEAWPSGYGAKNILNRIVAESGSGDLTVFVTTHDGIMKDVLLVYLAQQQIIDVRPIDWAQDRPVLGFMKKGESILNYEEPHVIGGAPRILDPTTIRRALFVANIPQISIQRFMVHNPSARLLISVLKPSHRSFLALLELPLSPGDG